jgi:superfamily I DNA/RNA helicase
LLVTKVCRLTVVGPPSGVTLVADRRRLAALLALKQRVQNKEHTCLLELFYHLLAVTGYASRSERAGDTGALLNLGVLSQVVAAFDEHAGTLALYPFLDYITLMREGRVDPAVVDPEDAVRIMTIHQAKDWSSQSWSWPRP